jgi:hypothetical protein
MQYAEHLPNPRRMVAPAVALVIGAAAATGAYALIDSEQVELPAPKIIVAEPPAQPGEGLAAKHEAATAAAIGAGATSTPFGKDEAVTATAIGRGASISGTSGAEMKDEAASAAAIGTGIELRGSKASSSSGGSPSGGSSTSLSEEAETARRTDPHGPASALP